MGQAVSVAKVDEGRGALCRALVLLTQSIIRREDFERLTGVDSAGMARILNDTALLADVEALTLRMQNSGQLARLEAASHARDAVRVAAAVMRDDDVATVNRLNAAALVSRMAGTDRPPPAPSAAAVESFRVTIAMPGRAPLVIENTPFVGDKRTAGSDDTSQE